MLGKLVDFIGRRIFSERESSEGILCALFKRETGHDLHEELAQLGASPEQVTEMFDDLHKQFGAGLLSDDRSVSQVTYPAAALSLLNKLDAFSHQNDMPTLRDLR